MRIETVMLSVRVAPWVLDELKRIENDRFGYTRSRLVKDALLLLFDKFPDLETAMAVDNQHMDANGKRVLGQPKTTKRKRLEKPKKKTKK